MDRVREALFSILGTDAVEDRTVLDLFAGTGAFGLEALSRGATEAHFVEAARAHLEVLRRNIEAVREGERCHVHGGPVEMVLPRLARGGPRFGLIFMDPPYRRGIVAETLKLVDRLRLLSEDGRLVAEHESRYTPPVQVGRLLRSDHRRYGDTEVSMYSQLSGGTA
jgi:16S rRNA (guanine(966)-N(2))-methyltransferase RsmD